MDDSTGDTPVRGRPQTVPLLAMESTPVPMVTTRGGVETTETVNVVHAPGAVLPDVLRHTCTAKCGRP